MSTGAEFFTAPSGPAQRRYEAMRAYFVDEQPAAAVADRFGYSTASVHQMATLLRSGRMRLFADPRAGPKGPTKATGPVREKALALRARRLGVTQIAAALTAEGTPISAQTVWKICDAEGLPRLRGDDAAPRGPATQLAPVKAAALPGWPAEPLDLACDHAGLTAHLLRHHASNKMVYANADITKTEQAREIIAFADYWQHATGSDPGLLVFDSQLTTYKILEELSGRHITWLTLRQRGKAELARLAALPASAWKHATIERAGRYRHPHLHDNTVTLKGISAPVRQIAIKNIGRDTSPPCSSPANAPPRPKTCSPGTPSGCSSKTSSTPTSPGSASTP